MGSALAPSALFNQNGGDAGSPTSTYGSGGDYEQLLNSYSQYLPQISSANTSQLTPTAQAQLAAAQSTNAGYQGIANSNTQAGGASLAQLLSGSGAQAATAGQALNQQLNPNYYANIGTATGLNTNAAGQANNLLNAINLNGLSPGEFNATQRAQNQGNVGTGNLGLLNNSNTIANAMNFGGAFNNKLGILGSALGSANSTSGAASNTANAAAGNAGFSPTGTAATAFQAPSNPQTSSNAQSANTAAQNSLMSSMSGIQQAYIQPQATSAFQNSIAGNALNSSQIAGNICCFIFLESYNGKLPWFVRSCRDFFYKENPAVARGYVKMANWLVPLIKHSSIVKFLVNSLMVTPITKYGGWLLDVKGYEDCSKYRPFKTFWFSIWNYLGEK